jgi:hypothetical protein
MIYSQYYLMEQGLAVTWNNPDIELRQNGVVVPSTEVQPGAIYEITAQIWNGSIEAPVVHLPVQFSYLQFGIGTKKIPIGETFIDLPVKGAPGLPVKATLNWSTPTAPGHYCLQVEPIWAHDANPFNNLGQENVDIKPLNSPHATFTFPVQNNGPARVTVELRADFYTIGPRRTCADDELAETNRMTGTEVAVQRRYATAQHSRHAFPVPEDWHIEIEPTQLTLAPDETADVVVEVTAPDDFTGRQAFNINAFTTDGLFGGITLYVEG